MINGDIKFDLSMWPKKFDVQNVWGREIAHLLSDYKQTSFLVVLRVSKETSEISLLYAMMYFTALFPKQEHMHTL